MARIQITYTTTKRDFVPIDIHIENIVAQHGGTEEGGGMGPEGRELVFNVFPDTEVKNIRKTLASAAPKMKYMGMVESLTLETLKEE